MDKIVCENTKCKHHQAGHQCGSVMRIGANGRCQSFEKGFFHYLDLVLDHLRNSNFIDFVQIRINPDLRIGIYYICKLYHLIYSETEWGTCRFLKLHADKDGPALKAEEILQRECDEKQLFELYTEFMKGNGPTVKNVEPRKSSQPFGWLSPTGAFLESDFGTHEEAAEDIIEESDFEKEFKLWREVNRGRMGRDFLNVVKGYCLIHNPSGSGGYIVSHTKPLTKKQREFLYTYFSDMGDSFKAEEYL